MVIELEKFEKLKKRIFKFGNFKNIFFRFDNMAEFLNFLRKKKENLLSLKESVRVSFEKTLPIILKHSRDQKFHDNIYWDSGNYIVKNIHKLYVFLYEQKSIQKENLLFVYKINFPFHLQIFDAETKNEILLTKHEDDFTKKVIIGKKNQAQNLIFDKKINLIKNLNEELDDIIDIQKTLSDNNFNQKIDSDNYNNILKKIKKETFTKEEKITKTKKKKVLIKLSKSFCKEEKDCYFKTRKIVPFQKEFLNLNFSHKYILNLTFLILLESCYYIAPDLIDNFTLFLKTIFSQQLSLLSSNFFDDFVTTYNEEYFTTLDNFKTILSKIAEDLKIEENKKFVENLKDNKHNCLQSFKNHRFLSTKSISDKKEDFKDLLITLKKSDSFSAEKIALNLKNKNSILSIMQLDLILILVNQLYQRIGQIWFIVEKTLNVF